MTARWPAGDVPTAAENRELVARAQAGDRDAEAEAVVRNIGLVCSVAIRYARVEEEWGRPVDLEDIEQEGAIGMLRAIREYDPSRGVEVSTVLTHFARNAIVRHLYGRFTRPTASLDAPIRRNPGSSLGDMIPCPASQADAEIVEIRESMDAIWQLAGVLDPREARTVRMRAGLGRPRLEDIAPAEGVTTQRVRQILDRAEYRIKLAAKRAGLIDSEPELPGHIVHDRNWRERKKRKAMA